ncbi:F1F0 ATP synthase subunit gamma [Sugiyamaella lignohabitans]|uniref:ATP synthase subunit gamma n=1 Tax=Sugiyamaella lignohabitans TaxID=796027 RepID=A0A167DUD8_9ASCO|nr:F1F0 ATP synthase subunit gamma [Sugiyamaella lignohabitans]ANB13302.1 F1F0 ATP synthase subunit gamma [Sugiyamaella lignohabitans]
MIVASTRLGKAQRAMAISRIYGETTKEVFDKSEAAVPENSPKKLLIVMSSDKGLCGSIHSQLARAARARLEKFPDADVVAVGDKTKAQLSRTNAKNIVLSISQIGKEAPTFNEAAVIADQISQLGKQYDDVEVLYNKFVSGVSFEPTIRPAFTTAAIEEAPKFSTYELEDEVVGNLSEFSLANYILWGLAEGHAAEISARRSAMDNASKNANEMIGKYSILYNRTRQAVITNELVDIITGASSLE